jgi:hypothetical protein
MVPILHPKGAERSGPLGNTGRSTASKMVWLFAPPQGKRDGPLPSLEETDIYASMLIGSHRYWIRVWGGITELCRRKDDQLIAYEVLRHEQLGISDDDIEDAIRQANGEVTVNRDYPVSDHIRRKLQILYEPE